MLKNDYDYRQSLECVDEVASQRALLNVQCCCLCVHAGPLLTVCDLPAGLVAKKPRVDKGHHHKDKHKHSKPKKEASALVKVPQASVQVDVCII